MVTYFGVFKYGDVGPDCLLHEMFDLQRAVRPQVQPVDPPWISSPVLGPCAAYRPPNMYTGEVDATPVATGRTGYPRPP